MPVASEHSRANMQRGCGNDVILRRNYSSPSVHGPSELLSPLPDCVGCWQINHHAESFAKPLQDARFTQPTAYFEHDHAAGCEFAGVKVTAEILERIPPCAQCVDVHIAVRQDQSFHRKPRFQPPPLVEALVNRHPVMPDRKRCAAPRL